MGKKRKTEHDEHGTHDVPAPEPNERRKRRVAKPIKPAGTASFWEAYKDPRWQKKRLEIMERDEWQCRDCLSAGSTLNVHHEYYRRDFQPWEYPDESLVTLCKPCHDRWHTEKTSFNAWLAKSGVSRVFLTGFCKGRWLANGLLDGEACVADGVVLYSAIEVYGFSMGVAGCPYEIPRDTAWQLAQAAGENPVHITESVMDDLRGAT